MNLKEDFYLALVLEPGWVQAGIWSLEEAKAQITSTSPPIAWGTEEDLLGAVDAALSAAVQSLPEDFKEPAKTIFGVPAFWVQDGQIKAEHLEQIKKICKELALEPAGFVVLPEAVAHFLKSEEKIPLNGVVVGIGEDFLEVVVFKTGVVLGTAQVARSPSLFDDLAEGLSRLSSAEAFPPRIIIYDGKKGELEEEKQSLLSADWESLEKIKFHHPPQVEVFPPEKKVLAVSLAGGSEIGGAEAIAEESEKPSGPSPEELGFVVGEDVARQKEGKKFFPETLKKVPKITFPKISWQDLAAKIRRKLPRKAFLWVLGMVGTFFCALFIYCWFYPKANIVIYVSPKKFEEKIDLKIETAASSLDLVNNLLPGKIIATEVSGEKTKATTGTKRVGEKARGNVKIQNGTAAIINLTAGTVLVSTNDLKFTLDSTASVSAALSPSLPGIQTAAVTAYDIGAEYNLAKDESFKIGNYPKADVDAVATADFSGGSSREISAVAAEDQQALNEGLLSELLESAKSKIGQNISESELLIDSSLVASPLTKEFSSKINDESANLKLSLSLKVEGLVVAKRDLTELAKKTLAQNVPTGFVLREDQIGFAFEPVEGKEDERLFSTRIMANFLPEINSDEIIKQILGRTPAAVQNYLASVPGFVTAEIKLNPLLPGPLGTLPRIAKHINLEVSAER
jgi:hypothetical protein